ncbi:MAG: serine/threonine protein kinase [Phycisphaerae bacterium]|jgi:serine/threonine protein kinase|nr:serine/threonine protein kinase [Phycisphaerae bacterium]
MATHEPTPERPAEDPALDAAALDPATAELFGLGAEQDQWRNHLREAVDAQAGPSLLTGYEILEPIGRGGQGAVYRARQPGTGRIVAIKRLCANAAIDPSGRDRFHREIDALTRLSHPNVVTVYAVEVVEGRRVLIMEYVDGPPIDRWADQAWVTGHAPLRHILEAFVEVCAGVSHGHQRGVVHCDIKPANVLVDSNDTPRILDFGIARIVAGDRAPTSGWTMIGFAGTPAYAAPEQATASPSAVDTRSDVYALGVLLFRLVAGVEPFAGTGIPGLAGIAAIAHAPARSVPSVRMHRRAVSRELDWIIARASALDPADRYQTADALADDIRRFLAVQPVLAHRPDPMYVASRFVRRNPIGVGLGVASLLAVLGTSALAVTQASRLSIANQRLEEAVESAEAAGEEARTQRERVETEAAALRNTTDVLYRMLAGATVYPGGFSPAVDEPMRNAYALLLEDPAGSMSPEIELELRFKFGITLRAAGKYEQGIAQLERAMVLSRAVDAPDSARRWKIIEQASRCLMSARRIADAERLCREALDEVEGRPPGDFTAMIKYQFAILAAAGNGPKEEFRSLAVDVVQSKLRGEFSWHRIYRLYEEFAIVAAERGWHDLAEAFARPAADAAAEDGRGASVIARMHTHHAEALLRLDRYEEAESIARLASESMLKSTGPGDEIAHRALVAHAAALHRLGRFREAATRWELASRRPLTFRDAERAAAPIVLRLAAAQFGARNPELARNTLRRALAALDSNHAEELAQDVEVRLKAAGWQVGPSLARQLENMPTAVGEPLTRTLP